MARIAKDQVTDLLATTDRRSQRENAAEALWSLVYDELRGLAERLMRAERRDHTLEPTALVHEAYMRLVDQTRVDWQGQTHFRAVAAQAMRRLLIDHARTKGREKRGAAWQRVSLSHAGGEGAAEVDLPHLVAVNAALDELAVCDQRQARVVELRFFGGLSIPEVAQELGVSTRTVEGDWTHAKAWLKRKLAKGGAT